MSENKKPHSSNADRIEGVAKGLASSAFSFTAAALYYADSLTDLPEAAGDIAVPVLAVAGMAITYIFAKEARGTCEFNPLLYAAAVGHIGAAGFFTLGVNERLDTQSPETQQEIIIEQTPVEAAAKADAKTFVWQPV